MEDLRFIDFGFVDPFRIMAVNEALFRIADREDKNLGFMWIPDKSIIMGYSQIVQKELNLERCKKLGYPVTRRITGGGTAFQSPGSQIHYGFIGSLEDDQVPFDMVESYAKISGIVIHALEKYSLEGVFKPINDVLCNGKKISGAAHSRGNSILLQHGTLIVDFNIKEMLMCCNIPLEKISDKGIKSVEERMTDLKRELGRTISLDEAAKSIKYGFEKTFGVELVDSELTSEEKELSEKLLPKYHDEDWIFRYARRRHRSAGSYERSPEVRDLS